MRAISKRSIFISFMILFMTRFVGGRIEEGLYISLHVSKLLYLENFGCIASSHRVTSNSRNINQMAGPIFSLGTSTDDAYMHALKLSPITVKPLIPKAKKMPVKERLY